jgi:hypothetical protein
MMMGMFLVGTTASRQVDDRYSGAFVTITRSDSQIDENPTKLLSSHSGACCRIQAGVLRGLEGTVICRRGNDRLLIRLHGVCGGIRVEIDAHTVQFLDESKR